MRSPEDILKRPYITEKSNAEMANGKYTFVVDTKATKTDIRKAVEQLFGVRVLSVNTLRYSGKQKRMGVHQGYRADWKKAVVKIDGNPTVDTYLGKGNKELTSSKKYKSSIEEFGVSQ